MPVTHLTFHAYGTWHPDHPSGWHQHSVPGTRLPAPALATHRRTIQHWPTVSFTPALQFQLIEMTLEIAQRRSWRLHATTANPTHLHILTSWRTDLPPKTIHTTFKRLLGWRLAQLHTQPGRPWFSKGGNPSRVTDPTHLSYLITDYFPKQGGTLLREGDASPI